MERVAQYLRKMRSSLKKHGRKREDIEDLVQDAFVRLLEYCETGREVREPEAVLVRTVQRLSLNLERDAHRDLYEPQAIEHLALIDSGPKPDDVLAADQCLNKMKQTLDTINRRTCEIFFLHRLEGLSYAQIAQQQRMPVSTVEKHIARAMTVLLEERRRELQRSEPV